MSKLNTTFWSIITPSGSLYSGSNSKTNGLYGSEKAARTQLKSMIKLYQKWADANPNDPRYNTFLHDAQSYRIGKTSIVEV